MFNLKKKFYDKLEEIVDKPEMQCVSSLQCVDDKCKHKKTHEHNEGCEYPCYYSDGHITCDVVTVSDKYRRFVHRMIFAYRQKSEVKYDIS